LGMASIERPRVYPSERGNTEGAIQASADLLVAHWF
jgi:hypothetical protein